MKNNNVVYEKAFGFSITIINLYKHLCNDKKEFILSKQLVRSGTSIGANIKEAEHAQSKKWVTKGTVLLVAIKQKKWYGK